MCRLVFSTGSQLSLKISRIIYWSQLESFLEEEVNIKLRTVWKTKPMLNSYTPWIQTAEGFWISQDKYLSSGVFFFFLFAGKIWFLAISMMNATKASWKWNMSENDTSLHTIVSTACFSLWHVFSSYLVPSSAQLVLVFLFVVYRDNQGTMFFP